MKTYARTYWFTWGFLVLAALFTGGAVSLKDAFFGGLLAALLSAALTRPYERVGLRYAPLLGAAAGAAWVLLGMLRLLKDGKPGAEQMQRVATASASGEALMGILNSILDYSKIESGKIVVDPVVFRLDETLSGIIALMRPSAEEKGLNLELDMAPEIAAWFEGDAGKIRQILFNLVSNAIKFTPSGKIALRARTTPTGQGRQRLTISVADTGIGIPEAKRQSIFESFTQTDNSITRRYGGTGLGLCVSHGMVRACGGDLRARNAPHGGAVFTVELPAA